MSIFIVTRTTSGNIPCPALHGFNDERRKLVTVLLKTLSQGLNVSKGDELSAGGCVRANVGEVLAKVLHAVSARKFCATTGQTLTLLTDSSHGHSGQSQAMVALVDSQDVCLILRNSLSQIGPFSRYLDSRLDGFRAAQHGNNRVKPEFLSEKVSCNSSLGEQQGGVFLTLVTRLANSVYRGLMW